MNIKRLKEKHEKEIKPLRDKIEKLRKEFDTECYIIKNKCKWW